MLTNLDCTLASPGRLFRSTKPGPHPGRIKSEYLWMWPRLQYFCFLANLMGSQGQESCLRLTTFILPSPFSELFLLASQGDLSLVTVSKVWSRVTVLEHFYLALSLFFFLTLERNLQCNSCSPVHYGA